MGAADANTDCVAQLQCGNQVTELTCGAGVDRLTGATLLVAGTCADCGAGTWGVASGLTDCATYTAAGNQLTGETRAVGRTKNLDQTSIAACAANTYAGTDTANCVAQTVCGAQTDTTARLTGASLTAAGTCEACDTGSWGGTAIAACTPCTTDANAATGATHTCTSATNSQISACKALYWKDTTGAADVCKAVVACGKDAVAPATPADRTTTTAASATANTVCGACQAGYWAAAGDNTACAAVTMKWGDQVAVGGAAPVMREITGNLASTTAQITCGDCTAGTFPSSATGDCTACTLVAGSIAGTPLTCTSASDSRVTGHKCLACAAKTVGAAGAHDTCTEACAAGSYRANTGLCTPCTAGTFAPNGQTNCAACTIANADATANAVT